MARNQSEMFITLDDLVAMDHPLFPFWPYQLYHRK